MPSKSYLSDLRNKNYFYPILLSVKAKLMIVVSYQVRYLIRISYSCKNIILVNIF